MTCGIYAITHRETGRQYVGRSVDVEDRWAHHYSAGCSYIGTVIQRYGSRAFDFEIIEECDRDQLDEREIYWIAKLGTMKPSGFNLGRGGKGVDFTPEVRAKMSTALKGRKVSDETKRIWSRQRSGRTLNVDWRRKVSEGLKGKPKTAEHRIKTGKARASLTEDQVRTARDLAQQGVRHKDIAESFGCCTATISHICSGRSYKWVAA